MNCPLCHSHSIIKKFYHEQFDRWIYHCEECDLRFVERGRCLDLSEQSNCYENHKNSVRTDGYTNFLSRLINPLIEKEMQNKIGLDYGSGPYPMLQELLLEEGFQHVDLYDPIYANNELALKYNFITCCEVVEHFINPNKSWAHLCSLLADNAVLVFSTGLYNPNTDLLKWSYIQDITHINFYSVKAFEWIASNYKLKMIGTAKDLIILEKE